MVRAFPDKIQVRDKSRGIYEVHWPIADHLIGNEDLATLGVLDDGSHIVVLYFLALPYSPADPQGLYTAGFPTVGLGVSRIQPEEREKGEKDPRLPKLDDTWYTDLVACNARQ